jgi:hypothetical protein
MKGAVMERQEAGGKPPLGQSGTDLTPPRVSRHFASKLTEFGLLVGPTLAVLAISQLTINERRRETMELVVATALLTAIFWLQPLIERRLKVTIPAVLVVILGIASFHFMMKPAKEKIVSPPVIVQNPAARTDDWEIWAQQVREQLEKCKDDKCLASAISAKEYPRPNSSHPVDQLNADIRAGAILMNMSKVFDMLDRRIGVKRNFIGDGLALPHDETRYWQWRVPEYLIENYSETYPYMWTWELASPYDLQSKKVSEILKGEPIPEIKGRNNQQEFLQKVEANVRSFDKTPAVIRFAKFPRKDYSRKIGPNDDVKRVFVLRLRDVYDMTLADAAYLSGHSLKASHDGARKSLWIWVYLPSGPNDLVHPTWGEIVPNITKWLGE